MILIGISGMIGTGKTTLANALSEMTGWPVIREDVRKNLFLACFYEDMERWALASQLSFMMNKTRSLEECVRAGNKVVLVDRTIQEDFCVFCTVLKKYEIISDSEHQLIENYYRILLRSWPAINFSIYLEDSDENCFHRLLNRGDIFESKIELGYIKTVGEQYREWRNALSQPPSILFKPSVTDFRIAANTKNALDRILALIGH